MPPNNYRSPWGEKKPTISRSLQPDKKFNFGGVFWAAFAFVVFGFSAVGLYLYYSPGGLNVSLEFAKPARILVGEPFALGVSFSNFSDSILRNARISIFVPDDVAILGRPQSQRVIEKAVGDLGPGSVGRESFDLVVLGGGEVLKRVTAKLQYSTSEASSAQFETSANVDLLVGGPAVGLTLSAPESVYGGQSFEVKIAYANNSSMEFKNVRLKMDYPPFFNFERSTVKPQDIANNSWNLGNLAPGSSGNIIVTGNVVGFEQSFFNFDVSMQSDFLGNVYRIGAQSIGLSIASSPLSLDIRLNNSKDYIVKPNDILTYTLTYKNNSNLIMQDVVIRASLKGEMFNFQSLSTNAVFDSRTNTISWFGANTPQLLNIGPGQTGAVSFSMRAQGTYPIRLLSDKNYTLKVEGQIESRTIPSGTSAEKTISLANLENKVAGYVEVDVKAFWRDAASGILNQGPYPPKANTPTQYTIHWIIRNYATDITDVALSAFLQSGARFTGQIKSNIESAPVINANSGLVTWNIGSIPATKGVVNDPIEAIFQVEVTPATTQVGEKFLLMGETRLEATDAFTGLRLSDTANALDSDLVYDQTISARDRRVQP